MAESFALQSTGLFQNNDKYKWHFTWNCGNGTRFLLLWLTSHLSQVISIGAQRLGKLSLGSFMCCLMCSSQHIM